MLMLSMRATRFIYNRIGAVWNPLASINRLYPVFVELNGRALGGDTKPPESLSLNYSLTRGRDR
jgi:hypothetical protein